MSLWQCFTIIIFNARYKQVLGLCNASIFLISHFIYLKKTAPVKSKDVDKAETKAEANDTKV